MLIDYEFKRGHLFVSYVNDEKGVSLQKFYWPNPLDWTECEEGDPQKVEGRKTWDGMPVKLVSVQRPSRHSVSYFLEDLPEAEKDTIFGLRPPKVFFVDIETEVKGAFESPATARNRVLSISIVNGQKAMLLGIKPLSEDEQRWISDETNRYLAKHGAQFNVAFRTFACERDMMEYFIADCVPQMPVITGWNFVEYDWAYLMNRARLHLDIDISVTSPTRRMNRMKSFENEDAYIMPAHRVIVDYMDLTTKWKNDLVKVSAKLDWVCEKELGTKKVAYEGDLSRLYEEEYPKYLHYNLVDSALVYFLDKKIKLINIMQAISNLAHVRMQEALGTVSPTEGILRMPLLESDGIVFTSKTGSDKFRVEGGYVKNPKSGMKKHVSIFDFASLYPHVIMEFNVAPESYLGLLEGEWIVYRNRKIRYDPLQHITIECDIFKGTDWATTYTTVFKNEDSTTRKVFRRVYGDRKTNQDSMKLHKARFDKLKRERVEIETRLELAQ